MSIGNATRTCSLALERLPTEISSLSRKVEVALALRKCFTREHQLVSSLNR